MPLPEPSRIVELLHATELFSVLPEEDLRELARRARFKHVSASEPMYSKNVGGSDLYLLLNGRLKITTVGPRGNELLLNLIEPGSLCGEIAMVDGGARTVNAVAEKASDVLVFNRRYVLPIVSRNAEASMALTRVLCGHLRQSVQILEDIALHRANTRLWSRLMFLASRYGVVSEETGALRIEHGLSQQALADHVGITRVVVNRQLGDWRDRGLIEYGRGFVVLLDQEALEADLLASEP